jgi:hypothetical protein
VIHTIIPVGAAGSGQRWMFVTRVDGHAVYGRLWSARSGKWTKGSSGYARDAAFKGTPRCPMPRKPDDACLPTGANP